MISFRQHTRTIIALAAVFSLAACTALGGAPTATNAPTPTTEPSATPLPPTVTPPVATPTEAVTPTEAPPSGVINKSNAADLVEVRTISASVSWISGLSFSPVDHQLATFGLGRSVDVWDADTGKRTYHLGTQPDWGLGLAFSPDATKLVSGSSGGDVTLWDMSKAKKLATVQSPPTRVYDVAWSPDGERFAVVGQDSSRIAIFGSSGTKIQDVKTASGGWLWSVAWSKNYLAASNDSTLKTHIYSSDGYGNVGEVDAQHPAGELDFSPDEKLLIGCLRVDGTLHVWDTANWTEVSSWDAHPTKGFAQGCIAGDFSSDGSVYFTGGDDGNLIAWDVATGDRLKTFEYGKMVWKLSMSGDGKFLAAGLDDGQVKIIGLK